MSDAAGAAFGLASVLVSLVVLVSSLRPIESYRRGVVVGLLTIALVDSLADAFALWASAGGSEGVGGPLASIAVKLLVAGGAAWVASVADQGTLDVSLGLGGALGLLVLAWWSGLSPGAIGLGFLGVVLASVALRDLVARLDPAPPGGSS